MLINGEEHNDLCVGIDLGTTNSVLATVNIRPNGNIVSKVVDLDRAVDMYNAGQGAKFTLKKNPILPSCVYYNDEKNYQPIVGDFAKGRYPLRPYLVAKSIKSQMGKEFAEGLSSNVPDKTPAQVSSRILEHMLRNAAKIYHLEKIDDAVITVPANFDFIMRQATLKAAELAGIKIRKADGSPRQILLSEPRAVIYDFINQVRNGEIAEQILNLNTKKNVMVFDLGGGTLDITLHEISRREDAPEILKVQDIATNRYTLLGGDDFDLCLAQAMFEHYLRQYGSHADIVQKIRLEEKSVMSQLLIHAENLKLEVSAQKSDAFGGENSGWWDEDEDFPVGGNIGTTGYAYSDSFTAAQLEEIWRGFMGEELQFNDFKNLAAVAEKYSRQKNIIYPILDVLKKASAKLNTENVTVDAVIMNGGMSRFYMVINRLKKFFGFDPIVALDPDQAVARGAAVYHYFLHKYDKELADELKNELPEETSTPAQAQSPFAAVFSKVARPIPAAHKEKNVMAAARSIGVVFGSNILNESFYLVTFGGNYEEIIPAGKELPYTSERFTGFRLPPGKNVISVPIARCEADGSYRIIAKGNIEFPEKYSRLKTDTFVTFSIFMNEDKIIRMDAATCRDERGLEIMDHGTATISIATGVEKGPKSKLIAKFGGRVNPRAQLNTIRSLCRNVDDAFRKRNKDDNVKYSATLKLNVNTILAASNHREFAEPLLQMLDDAKDSREESFKLRCVIIARKIGTDWTPQQKRRLARLCLYQLDEELYNPGITLGRAGLKMNTKIQCVYTLSMCGDEDDIAQLVNLHNNEKFRMANLYTHAITKTEIDWIYYEFKKDCSKVLMGVTNGIQISAHALGVACKLDGRPMNCGVRREQIVSDLCKVIRSRNMTNIEISVCLLALGLICDRRAVNNLNPKSFAEAEKLLQEIYQIYDPSFIELFTKAHEVAQKMIQGGELSAEEEESLLMKWAI